jgi:GNAT superfamily N-acetyltransferase
MGLSRPVPIDKAHETGAFDCGVGPLNEYLQKYALLNHQNRSARTYVSLRDDVLIGYYSLAAGSVSRDQLPTRIAQGLGQYPVPITLLARLAVDLSEKGKGLGRALLHDAILRAYQASELVGSRAIVTHAKDDAARTFYERFDFVPSPIFFSPPNGEFHLYLLMKDVRKVLGA